MTSRPDDLHRIHQKNFRKRHQPSSDHRQATLRTEQAMENRYECTQNPNRCGATLNGNDIVRIRSLVLRRSGAGSLCIDVPRSRRAEWRRADAGRTNGPRAAGWCRARIRRGSTTTSATGIDDEAPQSSVMQMMASKIREVRPRHAAHPAGFETRPITSIRIAGPAVAKLNSSSAS